MKRLLKLSIVLSIVFFIFGTSSVFASNGETVVEEGTWLARQLEIYGIPTAIAGIISSFGTGGAIWLFTKGFRNSKKQMVKGLEAVGLTSNQINGLMLKLEKVENKLEELENKSKKDMDTTYQDRVIPLLMEVKELATELAVTKEELKNGALKIINLLTEGQEEEINKEILISEV